MARRQTARAWLPPSLLSCSHCPLWWEADAGRSCWQGSWESLLRQERKPSRTASYTAWKTAARRGTGWSKWGPLVLVVLSVPLVMADLTRHVLQDAGIWPSPGSDMYRPDCDHSARHLGGITCLSLVGWLFTIVFTYLGFACLIAGVLWGADIHIKLRRAWRDIRRARQRSRNAAAAGSAA
ncbi:hypothetical protein WJX72_009501 [[Myrmecia] bisecta]|uniref:Uncharacterized protein n=1 Tax=[Myrmecia] bisecta TaxID=41462 RepID=A0AAW1PUC6_9CHLO